MKIGGYALVLLLAAGSPSQAGLPDAAWPPPSPGFTIVRPPLPSAFARPAVPVVVFKGLTLKGVQFSRADRIPASLVAAIDRTEKTLLLALYDLRLPEVAGALLRAKARGVDVRLIYDESHTGLDALGSSPSPEYQRLVDGGVPVRILQGGGFFGIMHNKFAVFDGELLATGSFNWTPAADAMNFENAIFRSDAALAAGFMRYWSWMWGLAREPSSASAQAAAAGAGPGPPPADPLKPIAFAGGQYPRYAFSPRGGIEDLFVDAFGRAKRTIDVAIFSLYSQRAADALIAAQARGVVVRVAADVSQSRRSQAVLALADAGVALRLSSGRGGKGVLHHKYALIDGALLMTGSYNFSQNAELHNFENVLFTAAPGEVAAFGGEFAAVWVQAHAPAPGELPDPKSL